MSRINLTLHSVAAIAVAALASACSNDAVTDALENNTGKAETVTLVARQPTPNGDSGTRVGFDSDGKGYWQTGDAIGVWSNGDGKFNPFNLTDGAGGATATFTGMVTDGMGSYAVYPYNVNHNIQNNKLTYCLPETYTYTTVDQSFFPDEKDGNSFNMPMLGKITAGNTVSFVHLAGVICLLVEKMPAVSGTVRVTSSDNQLCGSFTAELTDTQPEITTSVSSENKKVLFNYSNATVGKPGVFYLPIAVGKYTDLTIEVSGDRQLSTTTTTVTMKRKKLQVVNVTADYISGIEIINDHKFIDLELPSGLLWAETNIGAKTAADDGDYFAWGDPVAISNYTSYWGNYKHGTSYSNLTKYNSSDNKTVLEPEDDAAYVNWGSDCRMPTKTEFEELINSENCTWTLTSKTNSDNTSISGYEVTSQSV